MSSQLFNRRITLTVGPKGEDGLFITELRIKFRVEQSSEANANKARIEVYNLSKSSRQLVEKPGNYLILNAGYGASPGRVFEGDIPPGGVLTQKAGPDFVTVFEAGDGLKQLQSAQVNQSFKPGINIRDVFETVADTFGLGKGAREGVQDEFLSNGLAVAGDSKAIMSQLTAKMGLVWNVQDGVLHIHPVGGARPGKALLISAKTGLIETPRRGDKQIEIKSLLQAQIRPGVLISLDSDFLKGELIVDKVIHEGDNYEKSFYSTIEVNQKEKPADVQFT